MKYLHLIWRNLMRKKIRTTLNLLSVFVAFLLFGALFAVKTAFGVGVELAGLDRLITIHKVSLIQLLPESYGHKMLAVDGVAAIAHGTWFGGVYQDPKNFFGQFAVDPGYLDMYPEMKIPEEQKQAWLANRTGAIVGLLDADLYGPNIPMMMGVNERPRGQHNKILPLEAYGVKLMSMGFLVDPNQAVIWRGPMIHNALRQFLQEVEWGDLDYLVVDLPPGTGDASLSLAQSLSLTGTVIVTTPQKVALSDVVRGVQMFEQLNVPILGVIENMSYFVASDTGKRYDIFGHGGGASMAKEVGVEFLGEVPLEPEVRIGGDEGSPIVVRDPNSTAAQSIRAIARKIAAAVTVQNVANAPSQQGQGDPVLKILN